MSQQRDEEIVERIKLACMTYTAKHGKQPTRLLLTLDDLHDLNDWLHNTEEPERFGYLPVRMSSEPEIYGMRYRVDLHAKELRVYFQES